MRLRLLLPVALMATTPVAAASQGCGPGPGYWAAPAGGVVHYEVAGGVDGQEWGLDAGAGSTAIRFDVGYRRIELDGARATPHVIRARVGYGLPVGGGWSLCFNGHGGGSRFTSDPDDGTVVAGGVGVELARTGADDDARLIPFIETRGLAARSSGTILGVDLEADGLAAGIEAGLILRMGRAHLRGSGAFDGFAAGLGVTPYPTRAFRLGLGYHF